MADMKIKELEQTIGYTFHDQQMLLTAMCHSSYANEHRQKQMHDNERLEFLGDAVLEIASSDFLFHQYPQMPEGKLTKLRASIVCEPTLALCAREIHLEQHLLLGKGEELSGGRTKKAILADAVEAVIGALYIDSGYESAERLVLELIIPEIRKVQSDHGSKDYKTLLQEFYQKKTNACPSYSLVRTTGPDHDRIFYVSVKLGDVVYGPASGKNKKSAEQAAAGVACKALGIE